MGLTTQNFDIVTRVAVGNGALVYRAVEKATLRQVALKLLTQDGEVDHRFDLDALFAAAPEIKQIKGSHVCQLLDAFRDDDGPVLAYEFANGVNGSDFPHERKLEADQALDVAAQLISALRSGERQRTPHGDLKPSNVVFVEGPQGRPYTLVLDWGLSAFRTDTPDDSLPFFAPERLAGGSASHSADLFSAGAVLFYLLTGKLLVGGATREALAKAWREVQPAVLSEMRPDLNPKLVQWICSLLALDPAQRPASAVDAATALAALNPPPPLVPPETLRPWPAARSAVVPPQSGVRPPAPAAAPASRASSAKSAPSGSRARVSAPERKPNAVMFAVMTVVAATALAGGGWYVFKNWKDDSALAPAELPGSQPSRTASPSVIAPVPTPPQRAPAANGKETAVATPPQQPPKPAPAPAVAAPAANNPPPLSAQAAPPSADPNIFLVESFDSPAGSNIAGLSGGVGWAAPWQGAAGAIDGASLQFPKYPAKGGALVLPPSKTEKTWSRRAGGHALFLAEPAKGDRWYLGLLLQHGDGTAAPNGEIQFNPFDVADPFNLIRIVIEDRGPVIRASLNDPKAFLEMPDDGKPVYVLARIDLDKPKLGNWDVALTLWLNPDFNQTSSSKAGKGITMKLPYVPVPPEFGLLVRGKRTQTETRIDEIRYGRHYENMVFKPMPPPKR